MTDQEIISIIKKSKNNEWYKNVELTFNFPYINYSKTFKGFSIILKFVGQQTKGWEGYNENLPTEFQKSKSYFLGLKQRIENIINNDENISDEDGLNAHWNQIQNDANNIYDKPFLYDFSETHFLIKTYKDYPDSFSAAYQYIVGELTYQNIYSKETLNGILYAYEFDTKNKSDITSRREFEEDSLNQIKKDFIEYLNVSNSNLQDYITNANIKYNEHINYLNDYQSDTEDVVKEWLISCKDRYETFHNDSLTSRSEMETTYSELLKLKAPAAYWQARAKKLNTEGKMFMHWILILVTFAAVSLFTLLWLTPDGMLASLFDGDKSKAIRWSIVFITFLSFLFIGIRALTKAMFSSFHLARDAEEREQLTYLYLSLSKEAAVDKEDRHLVLQSLFSRSESGLLKDDSGPTMPGMSNISSVIK